MNNVVLIGRLTRDPETRYIPQTETAVANFTLAVDRPMAKEKTADFIRIVAFGKTAELVEKYLAKGRLVAVQGRIQTGSYTTKEGETRYTTDVYAERVEFLEWGDKAERSKGGDKGEAPAVPDGFQAFDDEDDIPF